ncbi:hypothetical protein [Spirosoma aerolatum]|uniref:hypothetical protein n=1 Tax=Spirosoma aerolatum TaxID=1211326 RepID=UPI0012D2BE42|nr:hypothetical protein [Spirosoma aerolatum]
MKTNQIQNSERVYGRDASRVVMMLPGIVIHSSPAYMALKLSYGHSLIQPRAYSLT